MLTLLIEGDEYWDDENERFCYPDTIALQFEHSLVSLSKWEAEHHKIFLTPSEKTAEEAFSYVRHMLLTPDVSEDVLNRMTPENFSEIEKYIENPMTGTTFSDVLPNTSRTSERLSSELIYYWMNQCQIPKECEHWHLNRLFTLIRIHQTKAQKPKKVSRHTRAAQMAELNAARKAQMGTSG